GKPERTCKSHQPLIHTRAEPQGKIVGDAQAKSLTQKGGAYARARPFQGNFPVTTAKVRCSHHGGGQRDAAEVEASESAPHDRRQSAGGARNCRGQSGRSGG